MFLVWNQNGNERVWNLSDKNINRKLRKALKKAAAPYSPEYENLCAAKNIADMHYAIYSLVGSTPEFSSFVITSGM